MNATALREERVHERDPLQADAVQGTAASGVDTRLHAVEGEGLWEELSGVDTLLHALVTWPKFLRIYAEGHERLTVHLASLREKITAAGKAPGEPIQIEVEDGVLAVDGAPPESRTGGAEKLAAALRERGVKALRIRPDLSDADLGNLGALLAADPRDVRAQGGATAFLAGRGGAALDLVAAAPVVAGGEGTGSALPRAALTTEPSEGAPAAGEPKADAAAGSAPQGGAETLQKPAEPEYPLCAVEEGGVAPEVRIALAEQALRSEIAAWRPARSALLGSLQLLIASQNTEIYGRRRGLVLAAGIRCRGDRAALEEALEVLRAHKPASGFERPTKLARELLLRAGNHEMTRDFLRSSESRLMQEEEILKILSSRDDAPAAIAYLLGERVHDSLRDGLAGTFAGLARERAREFEAWACAHPGEFIQPHVLGLLASRGFEMLCPLVERVLAGVPSADQRRLVAPIQRRGCSDALYLLALNLSYEQEATGGDLLAAFGFFHDPMAVSVLKEVVHRCNTGAGGSADAAAAILALGRCEIEDGTDFLREVAGSWSGVFPRFRQPLRSMARRALRGKGCA